jgi:hypothetical protein
MTKLVAGWTGCLALCLLCIRAVFPLALLANLTGLVCPGCVFPVTVVGGWWSIFAFGKVVGRCGSAKL